MEEYTSDVLKWAMEQAWLHYEEGVFYKRPNAGKLYEIYYGAWWDWARLIYPAMPAPRSPLEAQAIAQE